MTSAVIRIESALTIVPARKEETPIMTSKSLRDARAAAARSCLVQLLNVRPARRHYQILSLSDENRTHSIRRQAVHPIQIRCLEQSRVSEPISLLLRRTLPPCGNNTKAARTWVDFYDQSGKRLNGFCALSKPADLGSIWFALEAGTVPPSWVYIELNDRQTNTKYKSNLADTRRVVPQELVCPRALHRV